MNTSTAPATTFQELVPDSRFLLQPPLNNPFLSSDAIALTRLKDGIEIEAAPRSYDVSTDDVLEGIIARVRRDVERHPESARAHSNLGLALLNRGDAIGATLEFEIALEHEPGNYVATVNLARAKLSVGDIEGASRLYRATLIHFPDDVSSLMNLALIEMRRGDFENAAQLLKDVVALNKKAALPRYHLAMALLKLGRANDAISHLKTAARIDVRSPELYVALGVAYTIGSQLKHAAKAFKTALTLAPNLVAAVHGLAMAFLQGGELQEAITLLQQQLERAPDDRTGREMLAHAYFNTRQYDRARSQLSYALQGVGTDTEQSRTEKARLANNVAACFALEGNRAEARKWLTVATGLQPGNALPYLNLGRLLLTEGFTTDAITLLESCKRRFSDDETTCMLLAISYDRLEDYDRAISQIGPLVEHGEASPGTIAHLGALLAKRGDDHGAFKVFEEGLRRYPLNPAIINNYAYTQLMKAHVHEARVLLNSLPKGTEMYPELLATFGLLRLWEGDLQQGRHLYQQATELASLRANPTLARKVRQKMHLELARAYSRQQDVRSAIQHARSGLSVKEGQADYRRDLQVLLNDLQTRQPMLFPDEE